MPYQVLVTPSAEKARRALKGQVRTRVNAVLLALENDPRPDGVTKLVGRGQEWRIRIGDYRILYEIEDEERAVTVFRIAHRREVYR